MARVDKQKEISKACITISHIEGPESVCKTNFIQLTRKDWDQTETDTKFIELDK